MGEREAGPQSLSLSQIGEVTSYWEVPAELSWSVYSNGFLGLLAFCDIPRLLNPDLPSLNREPPYPKP